MSGYRIISSDNHVVEPPDLWTTRIDPKFKGREPRVVRLENGSDRWFTDGIKGQGMFAGAQPGVRFEEPENLSTLFTFDEVENPFFVDLNRRTVERGGSEPESLGTATLK